MTPCFRKESSLIQTYLFRKYQRDAGRKAKIDIIGDLIPAGSSDVLEIVLLGSLITVGFKY